MKSSLPRTRTLSTLLIGLSAFAGAGAPAAGADARGEMLYTTYCIECHRAQIHWRDKSLVTDWSSLTAQVRRWQRNSGRNWDAGDTAAIARYLNDNYYRLPAGEDLRD